MNFNMFNNNNKGIQNKQIQQRIIYLEKLKEKLVREKRFKELQHQKMLEEKKREEISNNLPSEIETKNIINIDDEILECADERPAENEPRAEHEKYMNKLMAIINKILNNDVNTYVYREFITGNSSQDDSDQQDSDKQDSGNVFLMIDEGNQSPTLENNNTQDKSCPFEAVKDHINDVVTYDIKDDNDIIDAKDENNIIDARDIKGAKQNKTKKCSLNFSKINKINNEYQQDNREKIITTDTLLNKMNSLVKKVNDKLENEISKDMFMVTQAIQHKHSKQNMVSLICSMILDKLDRMIGS